MMDERGKSDGSVVPGKPPNKAGKPAAEAVEGRGPTKGNSPERNALRTQSREGVPSALDRVRRAAGTEQKAAVPLVRLGVMTRGGSRMR